MGRYTALDDPIVDQKIESHFQDIIAAIRARMEPLSIILRGSFGRGEGSVYLQNGNICFLSDYEIDVVTLSPLYRSTFKELTLQLTGDLGIQTGLRWARPDFLTKQRIGPLIVGDAEPTISLYEMRYGSMILYGEDYFAAAPEVNPADLTLESGMFLLLNRMAESMLYMRTSGEPGHTNLESYYWVNKTILACAEVLLLIWKQYHFSYAERGKRFAGLAVEKFNFLPDQGVALSKLVATATEYKLRPHPALYPESVKDTWHTVIPVVDQVFRYVIEEILDFPVQNYDNFPAQYLQRTASLSRFDPFGWRLALKLLDLYRCMRIPTVPKGLFSRHYLYEIVYSVVPLLYNAQSTDDCADLLRTARKWMNLLGKMDNPSSSPNTEKEYITNQLIWFWKVFCHG